MIQIKIHTPERVFRLQVADYAAASIRILNIRDTGGYFEEDVQEGTISYVPLANIELIECYPVLEEEEAEPEKESIHGKAKQRSPKGKAKPR